MDESTRRLNEAFRDIFLRAEVGRRQYLIKAAKADPVKHKTTLQWDGDLRWRYFDGGISRGVQRKFCYTTTRNAAGYFLSFVELVNTKTGRGERKQFVASKTRHRMKDRARRLSQSWKARKANRS